MMHDANELRRRGRAANSAGRWVAALALALLAGTAGAGGDVRRNAAAAVTASGAPPAACPVDRAAGTDHRARARGTSKAPKARDRSGPRVHRPPGHPAAPAAYEEPLPPVG